MVVYFSTLGNTSRLKSGKLEGSGIRVNENPVTGVGTIYLGQFQNGRLNGNSDCYTIEYTNNTFLQCRGPRVEGNLDGSIEIISWEDFSPDPIIPEGIGNNNENGKKHIYHSNQQTILNATRTIKTYNQGTEISTDLVENINVKIEINIKKQNNVNFINSFTIIQV
jgi:hypothetical protein